MNAPNILKGSIMVSMIGAAVVAGLFLTPRFGSGGSYAPLIIAVVANTWIGGLWPALLTQVLGGGTVFTLTAHPFGSGVSAIQVWSAIGFLIVAKFAMFTLLSVQRSQLSRQTAEQLEMIAQATRDCVWEWNLESGHVWRGGKVCEIFGCPKDQVEPKISWWRSHLDPGEENRVWDSLQKAIEGPAERWDEEYQLRKEDGSYITVSDRARILRNKKGRAVRIVGGMADVTAERQAEERLVYNASHDSLTGLPNRGVFLDRLEDSGASSVPRAVLFIDLDRFKAVNDSFGHQVGDQLLEAVSTRLRHQSRPGDLITRFGGDEFTVLLEGFNDSSEALQIAESILKSLSVPFRIQGREISITASIGIASIERGSPLNLLQHADIAMYRAKRQGRGRCHVFDPAFESSARAQTQMEGELHGSFQDGSLRLYYQPIVTIRDGSLSSFEALLRWQHPTRGLILPMDILPVAESAGLSIQLGKWVLRETCNQLRRWIDAYGSVCLNMNVNLSGADFIRPALIHEIKELLEDTGVAGESLIIELTETTIMESNVDVAKRLKQLRDMGIRIALDDFGKGHSSLGRLQDFPISILKIDSSFVKQIREGKRQILDAIIALAHELDLEITAEGVETPEQLAYLLDKGAAKIQGLLFSPAVPAERASALIQIPPWDIQEYLRSESVRSSGTAAG